MIHLGRTILCPRLAWEDAVAYDDPIVSGVACVIDGENRVSEEDTLVILDLVKRDGVHV